MDIAVFGLGYVGAVSAACLAQAGHRVVGVDSNQDKADLINAGRSPVVEKGVDEMIASAVAEGRLRATTDHGAAIRESELAIVCVGTPSRGNGDLDLTHVKRVCEDIAAGAARQGRLHRDRRPQHRAAGNAPRHRDPDPRGRIGKAGRRRFRRRLLSGVPEGEHGGRRLLRSAENRDRRQRWPHARHARSP